ncbi:hypothetical protein VTI28DRAFT_472 [Corynascus sepedonium]
MEPLVALGVASNVLQFVDFAAKLVSTATETAGSVQGATQRTLELEKVYESLKVFSSRLHQGVNRTGSHGGEDASALRGLAVVQSDLKQRSDLQPHIESLGELAADCSRLCQELLETVGKLHIKGESCRSAKAFFVALRTVWSRSKVKDLTDRINHFQKMINLHFYPILSQQHSYMLQALYLLRDESVKLRLDQAARFNDLVSRLNALSKHIPSETERQIVADMDDPSLDMNSAAYALREAARERARQTGSAFRLDSEDVKQLEEGISNLVLTKRNLAVIAREQAFLRTLNFPSRLHRHDDIPDAHERTFQWVLDPSQTPQSDDCKERVLLVDWLRHGGGMFWVSGKAGSGKSTLMKFIADHGTTQRLLEEWAGGKKLVIAAHYFWTAGTPEQKSQQGLLRALLYDIFCACPEQIPDICPGRWAKTTLPSSRHPTVKEWPTRELLDTLQMVGQRHAAPVKYCMFIDGADEFDGDHFDLSLVLKELAASPNFKLCLSSRPWNVFKDAFGADEMRKLYIHNLTRQDIRNYTQSQLSKHHLWKEPHFSKEQMESVVTTVTERADGVFLWVFLVTRLLRDGLVDGDTWRQLQQRLNGLPTDLEPFFKQMLEVISPRYHQNMAHILRIAVNARQPLNLQFYQVLEYEEEDKDYALNKSTELHSKEKLAGTLEQCRRRINARCGGLLEIKNDKVEFLHRTVRDFLLTRDMSDYLHQRSSRDFMVNLSTLKCYIFLFKCWMQTAEWMSLVDDQPFWREGLMYANDALEESEEAALMHLNAIEDLYHYVSGSNESEFLATSPDFVFRSEIIRAGVDRYVSLMLKETPAYFDSLFEWPLCTAVAQPEWSQGHMNIMARLLESGQDPNAEENDSAWAQFLQQACGAGEDQNFRRAVENSLFTVFLKHGARTDVRVYVGQGKDNPRRYYPCTLFVLALFHHSCSHRFSQQCLRTLEAFLDGSPDEIAPQLQEVVDSLRAHFGSRQFDGRVPQPAAAEPWRLRFLTRVMQEIITRGLELGLGLKLHALIPELTAVFPGATGSALQGMIRGTWAAQGKKRPTDTAPRGSCKKARPGGGCRSRKRT